jgi:hypothetical protein
MKAVAIILATLLFVAVFKLPIGYYRFIRIGVTIGTILIIKQELDEGVNTWVIIFGIITILFNPILPIYLGSKSSWIPIDLISGLTFLAYSFRTNKSNR